MARLLHVEASPRKDGSISIACGRAFLDAYAHAHPDDEVDTIDLWSTDLPDLTGAFAEAAHALQEGTSPEDPSPLGAAAELARRFVSYDSYLFTIPMWTFSVPYRMKHFMDVITQPGFTYSYSEKDGYAGLVTGKTAVVIYTRGRSFGPTSGIVSYDLQKPLVEMWLRFIGFTDVRPVVVEGLLEGEATARAARARGVKEATRLATEI
jgi:FMN-dependent NADH-azoreductase